MSDSVFLLTTQLPFEPKNMNTEAEESIQNLREALVSILDRNGGRWLRVIASMLRNEADAEDVIQEAVRRVLARNLPFPSEEQARRYLSRAIANSAMALYNDRKRERRRHIPIQEQGLMPAQMANPYTCIEEKELTFEKRWQIRMLQEGLMALSGKQLEALKLIILESHGASIRDIGMNNGIAYSTLRHRSRQGLKTLRKFLQRKENCEKAGDRRQKTKKQESEFRSQNSE
jgi:RNA polymerase sigma factor (sigma-70 family)